MLSKKSQGLPMNALVLGALALLVLVALAAMWISGGGNIFQGFSNLFGGGPSNIESFVTGCQAACSTAQNTYGSYDDLLTSGIQNSNYCTNTYTDSEGVTTHCYDHYECYVGGTEADANVCEAQVE